MEEGEEGGKEKRKGEEGTRPRLLRYHHFCLDGFAPKNLRGGFAWRKKGGQGGEEKKEKGEKDFGEFGCTHPLRLL